MSEKPTGVPDPGSDEAVRLGCTCPVVDNAHGWGYVINGMRWIAGDCPLHASHKAVYP